MVRFVAANFHRTFQLPILSTRPNLSISTMSAIILVLTPSLQCFVSCFADAIHRSSIRRARLSSVTMELLSSSRWRFFTPRQRWFVLISSASVVIEGWNWHSRKVAGGCFWRHLCLLLPAFRHMFAFSLCVAPSLCLSSLQSMLTTDGVRMIFLVL